ncbi:hypothetical protein [Peribacillus sp. NPDC058075]|uniref:hypothetical protein n=1 Tax=unclassified Peribacillus TaxID=2675266 RepID=UPI0036D77ECA
MKKFATLLPNDLVAGTPHPHPARMLGRQSAEIEFKAKLMGTEGARLLREKRVYGRPRRHMPRRLPDRPRKASACSGNQQFR